MLVNKNDGRSFESLGLEGIEFAEFRQNDTNGFAGIVRLAKGARFPTHSHPGWEETLVISGAILINDDRLGPGDYLYTEAGEIHDVMAEEDTMAFVSSERGIEVVD